MNDPLYDKIEMLLNHRSLKKMALSVKERTALYKEGQPSPKFHSLEDRLGYIATRMPATKAAIEACFKMAFPETPKFKNILDVGCGSGAVGWALFAEQIPFETLCCLDYDREMLSLAKEIAPLQPTEWIVGGLDQVKKKAPFDLICASYLFGELSFEERKKWLSQLWEMSSSYILIVEPGTPRGFEIILEARDYVIEQKGFILAPCPHLQSCPMQGGDKWCHFKKRLNRSSIQRKLKNGTLSYEDENFSFIFISKDHLHRPGARIVSFPKKENRAISVEICTEEGKIEKKILNKKEFKNISWGDFLPKY